ncbi:transketolase family protein [Mediterraneibacter agrestimuris]|uniref:transketolase family protein n=1 Tax=Mediterraneibacter agrestimuris TaxID=2941333 RepID=UPI00203D3AFF|nr:transketolase C-terminal domain-containing protein [Mediterraneibacter agrestimuris]
MEKRIDIQKMELNKVVGAALLAIAEQDKNFMLLAADVEKRIFIDSLLEKYPHQFLDVGIAEENLIGVASGLAHESFNTFAVSYAPFITARVLDDIKVNLSYMKAPVKLLGLASGLTSGDLGATHTCLEDIAQMRTLPYMTVISPSDNQTAYKAILSASKINTPVYIRFIGTGMMPEIYTQEIDYEIGKGICVREGTDIGIVSSGPVLKNVLDAASLLSEEKISCKVIDMHTIKPLDVSKIEELKGCRAIVSVEEHTVFGGLGSAIAEYISDKKDYPPLYRIGTNDEYFVADLREHNLKRAQLDTESIFKFIKRL